MQSDENYYNYVKSHFEVLTMYIFYGTMPVGHSILNVLQGVTMSNKRVPVNRKLNERWYNMYTVRIWNDVEKFNLVVMVFPCVRFTKKEYDNVLGEMFYWACQGCENRALVADVFKGDVDLNGMNDERGLFSIYDETITDGETIDMYVHNNSEFYRKMNIAC